MSTPLPHMVFTNPFIHAECMRLGIAKAPIATSVFETYGQCNEDLIVESILRAALFKAGREMGSMHYVEIGGNHPVQTSSTYLFYRAYGARGVLCEANASLAAQLERHRPGDRVVNCAVTAKDDPFVIFYIAKGHELSSIDRAHIARFASMGDVSTVIEEATVKNMRINAFLKEFAPGPIDYLSVDVEGQDYDLLGDLDVDAFRPFLIQCEHESNVRRFAGLLAAKGYDLIAVTNVNALFMAR